MKHFTNLSLKIFFFLSILIFLYAIYRAEIHYLDHDRKIVYAKYSKYIFISIFFSLFFFISTRLKNEIKINIVISVYSLIIGLYIAELTLLYKFNYLPKKETEINFGGQKKYINKLSKLIKDEIYRFNGFDEAFFDSNKKIYPLGYLSNSNIYLCHETGKDVFYKSDRYGFRNTDDVWEKNTVDYILIGDSFVHGFCVEDNNTLSGLIKTKTNKNIINLGIGGYGPLSEYATFLEFAVEKKPKKVLWFFFEGNDLTKNLRYEKEIDILMNYLNMNEIQNLKKHQKFLNYSMKKKIIKDLDLEKIKIKEPIQKKEKQGIVLVVENLLQNTKFLRLWALRTLVKNSFDRDNVDPLFEKILKKTNKTVKKWNGELYFIYLPEKKRYSNKFNFYVSKDNFRNKKDIKKIVKNLNIKFIDTDKKVFSKFENPLELFDTHYNEKGYSLIVDEILKIN